MKPSAGAVTVYVPIALLLAVIVPPAVPTAALTSAVDAPASATTTYWAVPAPAAATGAPSNNPAISSVVDMGVSMRRSDDFTVRSLPYHEPVGAAILPGSLALAQWMQTVRLTGAPALPSP